MKTRFSIFVSIMLVVCMLFTAAASADAALQAGVIVTASESANIGLSLVLPEDMSAYTGASEAFQYAYYNETMLVGLAMLPYTDLNEIAAQRFNAGFATETQLTINGFQARKFTPVEQNGIAAIYELQEAEGRNILELGFYPADSSATEENEALIQQILSTVRSRSMTYAADQQNSWNIMFSHADTALKVLLPNSVVKVANPVSSDTIVEYQNDFVNLLFFAYSATVSEYIEQYDMNADEFDVTDCTVNGVNVHIFRPKSADISTDYAYIVAEGKDGTLLEIVMGTTDSAEEEENAFYCEQIIANISEL